MHAIFRVYFGNGFYHLWFREVKLTTKPMTRDMVGNGEGRHLKSYKTRDALNSAIIEKASGYGRYTVFQ